MWWYLLSCSELRMTASEKASEIVDGVPTEPICGAPTGKLVAKLLFPRLPGAVAIAVAQLTGWTSTI